MKRLTDDMTRLVGSIRAARDDRRRLLRDRKSATADMKRAVACLRSAFTADLAGARAAWLGAVVSVWRGAGMPGIAAPGEEREDVPPEPPEGRRRLKAKRDTEVPAQRRTGKAKPPAPNKARTVHKAVGHHRPR